MDSMLKPPRSEREERLLLDRLVGIWDYSGWWGIRSATESEEVFGQYRNAWHLAEQTVESIGYDESGVATAKVIYGYDPRFSEHYAFAVNAMMPYYDLERGHYEADQNRLVLHGTEYFKGSDHQIKFARTITFDSADRLQLKIDYPESDNPTYGELHLNLTRRPGTSR